MSVSVTEFRARRGVSPLAPAEARERWVRRRVGITWGLLFLDALTFYNTPVLVPIPHRAGQLITQGALPVALLLALTVNRSAAIRPNVFLCLVSMLVVDAVMTTFQPHHFGTVYRTFRLAEFVVALWLLSPWWGRRDLLLVRCHLGSLAVVLGSVLAGLLADPAAAAGRLHGTLWPMPPTEVAHYAAVTLGLVTVLWFGGVVSGRAASLAVAVTGTMLVLTHTRTALGGLVAGILIAGLSLLPVRARVRKFFAISAVAVSIGVITVASAVTAWLARGQDAQQLGSLTGRTYFWQLVLSLPRSRFQEIFGFGLSNGSIYGMPIDNNWLVAYLEQGLFGVCVCAAMLLLLLAAAFLQPRGVPRALALFLTAYCLVTSMTEVGYTNATTYLLDLTLAASLLLAPRPASSRLAFRKPARDSGERRIRQAARLLTQM